MVHAVYVDKGGHILHGVHIVHAVHVVHVAHVFLGVVVHVVEGVWGGGTWG